MSLIPSAARIGLLIQLRALRRRLDGLNRFPRSLDPNRQQKTLAIRRHMKAVKEGLAVVR